MRNLDFTDKVVLITGGSRGIGSAMVKEFKEANARVLFTYKTNVKTAEILLDEIGSDKVEAYPLQIEDIVSVKKCVKQILDKYGAIDVLINNAGINKDGFFGMMSESSWNLVLNTSLMGIYNVTKNVILKMISRKQGTIINISSISGILGTAGQVNYSTAKAGIIGFTKSLAKEMAQYKIRVNCIAPGFIKTDMFHKIPQEIREELVKTIPLGDAGEPSDVAYLALFLASDYARYITGQVYVVDGGLS